ncbi:MAG TPA: FKBP-type peptidyl-prolyl cis-trans isomerase [Gemmatimonadaceae bacterium]|nr:FKBP-type peptidyl-prolyl cis-trans isomerase [Gemmatimonadaceae bacterium]
MAVPFSRSLLVSLTAFVLAGAGVACSDTTAPSIEKTEFATSLGVDLAASTKTPSGLYYRDILVGTGATAAKGDTATLQYSLYNVNGSRLETGSFSFTLGAGDVIPGFDEGVTGMKVGGQRQLIIPPHLGYGNRWSGNGTIPPNSILVFDVQLQGLK